MFQNIQPQLILRCQFPPVQRGLNMSWCHVFNSFIQRVAKVPLRQGEFLPQTSQQGMIWGTGCVLLPCSLVTDSGAVLCHEEQRALKDVLNLSLASVFNIHFNQITRLLQLKVQVIGIGVMVDGMGYHRCFRLCVLTLRGRGLVK